MVIYAHFQCHTRHILCLIGYQAVPKSLTHRFSCGFGPQPFEPFSVLPTRHIHSLIGKELPQWPSRYFLVNCINDSMLGMNFTLSLLVSALCYVAFKAFWKKKGCRWVPHHCVIWLKNWVATIFFKEIAKGLLSWVVETYSQGRQL